MLNQTEQQIDEREELHAQKEVETILERPNWFIKRFTNDLFQQVT